MSNITVAKLKKKAALLDHHKRQLKKALKRGGVSGDNRISWNQLTWHTTQLVCDVGKENVARMFDEWIREIRKGTFGEFDGLDMTDLSAD